MSLKNLKETYLTQVVESTKTNNLLQEPVFAWWVPFILKKQELIISKVKSKYWSRTHKYGILIPKNIKEAFEIDARNGNKLWQEAIALEMKNCRVAFEEIDGDPQELVGYQEITGILSLM